MSFTLVARVGIRAAIGLMESEATVGQPEHRSRWSWCGNRQGGITVHPDTHPHEMQERERPRPETRAGCRSRLVGEAGSLALPLGR